MYVTEQILRDLALIKQGSYDKLTGDALDHTIYDEWRFAATTVRATTTFFSIGQGGTYGDGTKGLSETNLSDAGRLPSGQGFLVKRISFALKFNALGTELDAGECLSDVVSLMQNSVFNLKIAGREFERQIHGTEFLPSIFLAARATIVQATDNVFRAGDMLSAGDVKLSAPIAIGDNVGFNVIQYTSAADASVQTIVNNASNRLATQEAALQIRLHGTLVRSK